jgi:serine protease Do
MFKYQIALLLIFFAAISNCSSNSDESESKKVYSDSKGYIAYNNSNSAIDSVNEDIYKTRSNSITRAVHNCNPAIVGINVTEVRQVVYSNPYFDDPMFRRFFGNMDMGNRIREYKVQGLGSGFIISPDGYILTNHHVAGNASKIVITMTDGKRYDAEIIGSDMVSDVALLKINGENLPYLKLGNSDDIIIGEWAIAFGNPFGLFDMNAKPTVTVGVVSNDGINFLHPDEPYNRVYRGMIQTDAAISSGNSGGPLVNSLGEVIGMNTIIFSTAQNQQGSGSIGIGFSIPINRVKKIVDLLKTHKEINRDFYTGLDVREIDEGIAKYLGINKMDGVVVFSYQNNSPADKAGIKLGDIITEVEGLKIIKPDDFLIAVGDSFTGQEIEITLIRDGKTIKKMLKLDKRPGRKIGR